MRGKTAELNQHDAKKSPFENLDTRVLRRELAVPAEEPEAVSHQIQGLSAARTWQNHLIEQQSINQPCTL